MAMAAVCDNTNGTVITTSITGHKKWYLDYGTPEHMASDATAFETFKTAAPGTRIEKANITFMPVAEFGALKLTVVDQPGGSTPKTLNKDVYMPELGLNLISTRQAS